MALLLSAAITDMFGLAMIVPLLYVTGLAGPTDTQPAIVDHVVAVAAHVGVELTLPTVLVIFLGLAVVRTVSAWQRRRMVARIRLGFVDRLREEIYESVAAAKWGHLAGWRPSDLHHLLTGDVRRAGNGVYLLFQLVVGAVLAGVQLAIAVVIAPVISLGALLAGGALALATGPLVRRSGRRGAQQTQGTRKVHAVVADFLAGLPLVKSYNAEALHVDEYRSTVRELRTSQLAATATASMARAVLDLGAACTLAALVYLAVVHGGLALPELLVLVYIFARLVPSLTGLQQSAQQLAQALPAYVHATNAVDRLREGAEPSVGEGDSRLVLHDVLNLRGISFSYPGVRGRPSLSNVDLRVRAGEFVVVMGPSGAGKSTLAHLLLGLLEPCEGDIRIDDAPLTAANVRRWRAATAYVPQDAYLFHDTIRANMTRADPQASEAAMRKALDFAAAIDFVDALPGGLDTVVGDRGTRLSGGERQRIALAQALLRDPALLVLDEATAFLDADTERRVLAALVSRGPGMAVVAMTHHVAPAKVAERIVLLDSGRVAAAGTWSELAPMLTEWENVTD